LIKAIFENSEGGVFLEAFEASLLGAYIGPLFPRLRQFDESAEDVLIYCTFELLCNGAY
jgi:hypothetical protein